VLTAIVRRLFFRADDGTHGKELWKSNGTRKGTKLVKNIRPRSGASRPGQESGGPDQLMNVRGTVFFPADDGTHGTELWKSDGTRKGTKLVKNIARGRLPSSPEWLANVGGRLFFAAADGLHGDELWSSGGTPRRTRLVRDIWPGLQSSGPYGLTNAGGTLFFVATDPAHGNELWKAVP
jgi:ELWxxDGT repeat protein